MASEDRVRRVAKQRGRALERREREAMPSKMRRGRRGEFWRRPVGVRIDRQVGRQLVARLGEVR